MVDVFKTAIVKIISVSGSHEHTFRPKASAFFLNDNRSVALHCLVSDIARFLRSAIAITIANRRIARFLQLASGESH